LAHFSKSFLRSAGVLAFFVAGASSETPLTFAFFELCAFALECLVFLFQGGDLLLDLTVLNNDELLSLCWLFAFWLVGD
jgi:membrane protein DedA with SNARE-associated domain